MMHDFEVSVTGYNGYYHVLTLPGMAHSTADSVILPRE